MTRSPCTLAPLPPRCTPREDLQGNRPPGLIYVNRPMLALGVSGIPTLLNAPLALTADDLKAAGVEVALMGVPADVSYARCVPSFARHPYPLAPCRLLHLLPPPSLACCPLGEARTGNRSSPPPAASARPQVLLAAHPPSLACPACRRGSSWGPRAIRNSGDWYPAGDAYVHLACTVNHLACTANGLACTPG